MCLGCCNKTGCSNIRNSFSHSSGSLKSKVKVLADLALEETLSQRADCWALAHSKRGLSCLPLLLLQEGDPFQGPKWHSCLTLGNELRRNTYWQSKRLYWEGVSRWRTDRQGNPGGLLCHVAHSPGFYGDGISFWVVWPITLIQGPSWWHMHRSAKTGASEKDSGKW